MQTNDDDDDSQMQTAGRPTGIPIRDPQVTTVPLPVRNIGGSVSTHRQKGKNRQAALTGSYFRSVGAPKRQPLFRECDCEPDCEVMGSRSFLAWVWTCISIQPSSVGPVWSLHDTHQAKDACMNHRIDGHRPLLHGEKWVPIGGWARARAT